MFAKVLLIAAILLSPVDASCAASINHELYGCKRLDLYDKMDMLIAGGDKEMFMKTYVTAISTGECIVLRKGEKVFINDVQTWPPYFCVRPEGRDACYWTSLSVVDQ